MKTHLLISALFLTACGADSAEDSGLSACAVDLTATGWSEASHLKGVDGDYDLLFDDTTVHRIDLTICAGDYESMQLDLASLFGTTGGDPGAGSPNGEAPDGGPPDGGPPDGGPPDEGDMDQGPPDEGGPMDAVADPIYVPVTVGFDGRTWPAVGMRYKGNSSLMQAYQNGSTKLPFRLNFDYYDDVYPELDDQRFYGFEELKFSNAFGDDSLVRDKVAADLYRDAGIPAAKGSLVEIFVDTGEGPVYWGAYAMFEDPCGELLDSWFGDDDGNCYKADGTGATLASFDAASFENKTNDDDAAAEVEALVAALNDDSLDAATWRAGLEAQLDVDGFLRTLAASNLMGNWDAYGNMTHNYYLYADPGLDGRLVWIPWDFNLTFSASNMGLELSLTMDEVGEDWPLIRTLMDDPVYAAAYYAHLEDLSQGALSEQAQKDRFEEASALIASSAEAESGTYTNVTSSFEGALESNDDAVFHWIEDIVVEVGAVL